MVLEVILEVVPILDSYNYKNNGNKLITNNIFINMVKLKFLLALLIVVFIITLH